MRKKILWKKVLLAAGIFLVITIAAGTPAFASGNKIINSPIFTGAKALLRDIISAIQLLSGLAGAGMIGFQALSSIFIKDEVREKEIKEKGKRILEAVIIVFMASTIVQLILSYFTGQVVETAGISQALWELFS
jgi:hypothetical protein